MRTVVIQFGTPLLNFTIFKLKRQETAIFRDKKNPKKPPVRDILPKLMTYCKIQKLCPKPIF